MVGIMMGDPINGKLFVLESKRKKKKKRKEKERKVSEIVIERGIFF